MAQMPQGHVVLDGWTSKDERREWEAIEAKKHREEQRVQAEAEAARQQALREQQQRRQRMWSEVGNVIGNVWVGFWKVVGFLLAASVALGVAIVVLAILWHGLGLLVALLSTADFWKFAIGAGFAVAAISLFACGCSDGSPGGGLFGAIAIGVIGWLIWHWIF